MSISHTAIDFINEDEEQTVIEAAPFRFSKSKFYRFLHSHYNPTPAITFVIRYFKEVRKRMIELSAHNEAQYADSLFQILRRAGVRAFKYMAQNIKA